MKAATEHSGCMSLRCESLRTQPCSSSTPPASRARRWRVITRYHPVLSVPVVTIRGVAGDQETVTAAAAVKAGGDLVPGAGARPPGPAAIAAELLARTRAELPVLAVLGEREELLAAAWLASLRAARTRRLRRRRAGVAGVAGPLSYHRGGPLAERWSSHNLRFSTSLQRRGPAASERRMAITPPASAAYATGRSVAAQAP
jgi:hypothetical protein